jgi:hypothetical protein
MRVDRDCSRVACNHLLGSPKNLFGHAFSSLFVQSIASEHIKIHTPWELLKKAIAVKFGMRAEPGQSQSVWDRILICPEMGFYEPSPFRNFSPWASIPPPVWDVSCGECRADTRGFGCFPGNGANGVHRPQRANLQSTVFIR